MRTVDIICGLVAWGFGGAFLLYITGFFRWVRSWWNPGYKPHTRYDFDKNPPRSLFAEPETKSVSDAGTGGGHVLFPPNTKHMGEDVEWVMTRHATPGRPLFPENQALYEKVFAKRGNRWVKQKR